MRETKVCYHFIFDRFTVRQLIGYWIMHPDVNMIACTECAE